MALSPLLLIPVLLQITGAQVLRLVGGFGECDGELQMKHLDKWRFVTFPDFSMSTGTTLCRRMNCGSPVSHKLRRVSPEPLLELNQLCLRKELPLQECVRSEDVSDSYHFILTCSDFVTLSNGPSQCSGSVEVYWNQSWPLVCEEDFDLRGAEVVCRELGCGAPSLLQGVHNEQDFASHEETFRCKGHESALTDCPRARSGRGCPSGKVVALTCSEPVRLTGGSGRCDGTVEVRHRGQWRTLNNYNEDVLKIAAVVCPALDCGAPVSAEGTFLFLQKPVWTVSTHCVENWLALRDCIDVSDSTSKLAMKVVCSGKPKLLHLLWLIPAVAVVLTAVSLLIYCRKRRASSARRLRERPLPGTPKSDSENYENEFEDRNYQSLTPDTMDQGHYLELRPTPRD